MATNKASDLYKSGKLDDAIAAAVEQVRNKPGDVPARWLLSELLTFAGDFERADKHVDAMGNTDEKALASLAVYRQLLRAESARQQLYTDGRLPEFLEPPGEDFKLRLQAITELRAGNGVAAKTLLDQAEAARPPLPGTLDGVAFDDFRDLDDVCAGLFEVLTTTGKYYWVPASRVESLEFTAPVQPRDLIWRDVKMVVRDGPDGAVYLPCLYIGSHVHKTDDQIRLGRATTWPGVDSEPLRGAGLRTYLIGDEDRTVLSLKSLTFGKES